MQNERNIRKKYEIRWKDMNKMLGVKNKIRRRVINNNNNNNNNNNMKEY
jgi:hypothetical protein